MSEKIAVKTTTVNGFVIESCLRNLESGMLGFNDKWVRSNDGEVQGDRQKWTCNYYSIGQLNKGFDSTKAMSQRDFERDCEAFEVALEITVSKADVTLVNDMPITTNFNYDDGDPVKLLNELSSDVNIDDYIKQANTTIQQLLL